MNTINDQLIKSSQLAVETFRKLKAEEYNEIISNLEWCIGSYQHDGNPDGLLNLTTKSLNILKSIKTVSPRKVNKNVIDGLEKTLTQFQMS